MKIKTESFLLERMTVHVLVLYVLLLLLAYSNINSACMLKMIVCVH